VARVLLGALASDVRGSVGGATFQRSANGLTLKAKTSPVNPRTTSQSSNRSAMFYLQTLWLALTADQRTAWSHWAQFQNLSTGQLNTSRMSGQQAFMQINRYRLMTGKTVISDPVFTPYNLPSSSIEFQSSGATMNIVFPSQTNGEAYVPLVFSSFVLSPGRTSRPHGVRFVALDNVTGNITWLATLPYTQLFGTLPTEEDRLWVQYGFQQVDNGCLSVFTQQIVTVQDL
jgi:hypothetical protein